MSKIEEKSETDKNKQQPSPLNEADLDKVSGGATSGSGIGWSKSGPSPFKPPV